ncbi:MAG: DUF1801 domain-containing protein [Shewanella sp.]|uniref:DUF1801 domain-containing protein n=1 Tax=Shewanella sp. SNU WT4 TaxID=2590015 RepID=UPI00112D4F1B|nr:DUF1801 domain-containing protein [Shewanella sp. SNU WT4]QDF67214.1 DUF1801 domain-containing protein [Shewanella sp. SNU WT4]
MAELTTQKSDANVLQWINQLTNPQRQQDSLELVALFERVTGFAPVLWGSNMIGFGEYHYQSERSSQHGDWPLIAFSPRKQNMTIYIMPGFSEYLSLLDKLGKHKTSVSCLYFNTLAQLDIEVLAQLIRESVAYMQAKYSV